MSRSIEDLPAEVRLAGRLLKQRVGGFVLAQLFGDPAARLGRKAGRHDPYPIYRELRAYDRPFRSRTGVWVAARHETCREVLRDRRFLVAGPEPKETPLAAQARLGDPLDVSFLERDPPDHTRLRRLAAPAFRPKLLAGYRERIEQTTERLLDEAERRAAANGGVFEVMTDFAAPLPIQVISDLLGIPDVDARRFAEYGQIVGRALDGVQSVRHAHQLLDAARDLERLFTELIALRSREPSDDVVSRLVAARDDDRLTSAELLSMCRLLLIAGFETTVNLIGNGMLAMSRHPEEWAKLRDDPELAPRAVEEILRYDSPVQATSRLAGEDLELAGVRIPRGDWVVTLLGSANRDEAVYEDPDRFDITRDSDVEHLSFSNGIHYCLGAPLARLEGEIAFRALARRLPEVRPVGRIRRRHSISIRGLTALPLAMSPTTRPVTVPHAA